MHSIHKAAPGKYAVTDKAFVAQSVLFYNISCGLVFKIQTQNLTCLKKEKEKEKASLSSYSWQPLSQLVSAPLLMIWHGGYPFSNHIPNLCSNPCPLSSLKPQKPYLGQVTPSHVTHMLKLTLFWRMRFLGTLGYVAAIAGIWNRAWISHNFREVFE